MPAKKASTPLLRAGPSEVVMTGQALLDAALTQVESQKIRAWATSDHNGPIWLKIAENAVKNGRTDVHAFTAYIVCVAIGA
jgi:vacuolar-type H+-ATPase subunit B/Vma2